MKLKALALISMIVTGVALGASPAMAVIQFNTYPISYTQETNRDMPMIDARNVSAGGAFSASQGDHDNGVSASQNDIVEFLIYYHNTGVASEVAHNVMIKAALPGSTRQTHEVSATIDSDETSPITSAAAFYGGNINVNISGSPQTLQFIPGSVQWYPNRSTTPQTPAGADNLVGSGINIGSVQGCFDFSGFVKFRAKVGTVTENTYNLAINKKVLNVSRGDTSFADSTTARPGDRLRFEVRVETSGDASQNNVILRDILPSQLSWVAGSLRLDGSSVGNEPEFFGSGRNFGTLSQGSTRVLTFEAMVAGAGSFSGTAATIVNTANVRSDQVTTRQDETT